MTIAETATPSIHEIYYQVERAHWWFLGRKKILLSCIQQYLPDFKGKQVLDIGASTGSYVEVFQNLNADVTAHDASNNAIIYLKQVSNNGKICRNKFPDDYQNGVPREQYDLVLLFDVLEHIRDDRLAFETALKLVKPGGFLAITVPACMWLWGPYDVCNRHYRRYDKKELMDLLNCNNAKIKKLSYFSTFLFPLMLIIRAVENVLYKLTSKMLSFYFMPGLLNQFLLAVFKQEIRFLRNGSLPFGSSLMAIIEKNDELAV